MDNEYCHRCLPKKVKALGFIPLPEPSNIGDSRYEEQRILVCRDHYFEAKANCFYVVPFDRDDDPVDNFLTLVKLKHKAVRGNLRMRFGSKQQSTKKSIPEPEIMDPNPTLLHPLESPSLSGKNYNHKTHHLDGNEITCGLPAISVMSTANVDDVTCRNCISLLSRKELERDPDIVGV